MALEYTLRYKYNKIHHFPIFQEMVDFLFCISQIAAIYRNSHTIQNKSLWCIRMRQRLYLCKLRIVVTTLLDTQCLLCSSVIRIYLEDKFPILIRISLVLFYVIIISKI